MPFMTTRRLGAQVHACERFAVATLQPTGPHTTLQLQDQRKTEDHMPSAENPSHERPPVEGPQKTRLRSQYGQGRPMGPAQAGREPWVGCGGYKRGFMPMSSFTSSNTNQLMPAAGATFTRFGRMPCAPSNHAFAFCTTLPLQAG